MESKIDWSKAPEGADKYNTHNSMFYKGERPYFQVFIHDQWRQSAIIKSNELFVYRQTTPSWSGEGLPPVGVVCEWKEKTGFQWVSAEVLFISESSVVMKRADGYEWQMMTARTAFRPIRTPEQIAAGEREAAVDEMHKLYMEGAKHSGGLYALYDAGFRKP